MNIETMQQQTNDIQNAIKFLQENLPKTTKPIFIELIGTPKSGKTTLTNVWKKLCEKNQVPVYFRRETAEYNPIEDKGTEEYSMWMVMELIRNFAEDLAKNKGKIVIYDRGLFDRIPWLEHSVRAGTISQRDSEIMQQLYTMDLLKKYKPLTYGFVTSPELSIQRKGGEGRLVNRQSMATFNELFLKQQQFLTDNSIKYRLIETDKYQGRLKEFIMEVTISMLKDVSQLVKEELKQKEENCK